MVRTLDLPRLAVAFCLVPCSGVLAVACGGAGFADPPDAAHDAAHGAEAGGDSSAPDAELTDSKQAPDASARADGPPGADTGSVVPEAGENGESGTILDGGSADLLGSARSFAVLAGSTLTITPSPPMTTIIGDVGVSPGTAIVTLPPGQPVGSVFAGGPVALQAQADLTVAYNNLAAMPCLPANVRTGVDLGGKTLAPGVYCFPNTSAGITGNLVLDAQQDPGAVWVIQVGSTLTTATGATVSVINGGSACNVYWQIGSSATLGTGTQFVGNIVALTSISLVTGSTVLVGRTLARNGAVSLEGSTISAASCQ